MNFDKFTVKAQEAMATSQQLAMARSHTVVTPLHILYAMLDDEQGLTTMILEKIGSNPEKARSPDLIPSVSCPTFAHRAAEGSPSHFPTRFRSVIPHGNPFIPGRDPETSRSDDSFSLYEQGGLSPRADFECLGCTRPPTTSHIMRSILFVREEPPKHVHISQVAERLR